MRKVLLALLLSGSFVLAQDSSPSGQQSKDSEGQVTVQGCVSRATGDYTLYEQGPDRTYLLQGTGKIKLGQYLGQQVEVTGTKSPAMSTSSDALSRSGSPASTTLTVKAIKMIAKQCTVR